jgi:hypothetical protein
VPRYRAAGVDIESRLVLPGLGPALGCAAPLDVVVRVGETPPALPDALERGANWERAAGALLVSIPGLARFLVRDAGEIVVEPQGGAAPDDLAIFVAGPMLGILLQLRGRIVLQASAVAVGGGAVLFCGETAAGKSTLAAALGRRGYPTICDDLCAIDLDEGGGPRALADAATLKLWANAIRRLGLEPGPPVRAALQKYHVTPPAGLLEAAPVRAIYVLHEARPPDPAGIARANVVDLAILLRGSAFRPHVVRVLDQRAAYFAAATRLASRAGLFVMRRELGFERMDGVLGELEAHWTEIGLAPGRAA